MRGAEVISDLFVVVLTHRVARRSRTGTLIICPSSRRLHRSRDKVGEIAVM